ncbi:MAG: type II toxin-antitoxin system VapC family toxin [bacterium]
MLFDTDVLIWAFRGKEKAAKIIEDTPERYVSVITYMELMQGVRNQQESSAIKSFLSDYFHMLPLTENIGHRAAIYMEEYGLKAGMRLADALIAATAVENNIPLCTGNRKHYRVINELSIKHFKQPGGG